MKVAFVFPGQGSQEVGMGRALCEGSAGARAAFERADRALWGEGVSIRRLCFEGPLEELTLTSNTQPAILATSIACFEALREKAPAVEPALVGGHSLGEYSALVAAGALDFEDTVRLVRLRGRAMQDSVPPGTGSMAAMIGLDADAVADICAEARAQLPGRVVAPANYNAPGQLVIAGHVDAVARACEIAAARKGRAIALKVSAPFHCELMSNAAETLRNALTPIGVQPLRVPVVANVDAEINADPSRVKDLLVRQVAGAVRWEQCVRSMVDAGVDTFVEIGPGKVLAGLIKRIHKPAVIHNVSDPASLDATVTALASAH